MIDLNTKDIIQAADTTKRLVQDEEYYRYIFKKTEKIVSVVFYILYNMPTDSRTQSHIEDIQHAARQVHDAVLQSLETRQYAAEDAVRVTALALISLESKLRVAHISGMVTTEIMNVIAAEIDAVLRGMNKYIKPNQGFDTGESERALQFAPVANRQKTASLKQRPREAKSENPIDRRERIKTVLEAKGTASIKDIANIITDCSEKTIQRELNDMIEDNLVKRQGERRWSVYSIV